MVMSLWPTFLAHPVHVRAAEPRSLRSWYRAWMTLAETRACCIKQPGNIAELRLPINSALHPYGVAKSSTIFGWGKGGNTTYARWQVTLCDPAWHVISRNGVTTLRTSIHLLLILTYLPSLLWRCCLGGRKGIWPVKQWAVGYWRSYLSGACCRHADATATHCLLFQ